jgi:hypothetical protein
MLASTGCTVFGGKQEALVVAANPDCAGLVPSRWRAGVSHTKDPTPASAQPVKPANTASADQQIGYWRSMYELALGELKKWVGFGVSESQKVEDANGRTTDTLDIVSDCEKRAAAAVKRASH